MRRGWKMKADNPIDWIVRMWWREKHPAWKTHWLKRLEHIVEMEKYRRPAKVEHWKIAILAARAIVGIKKTLDES